jgi:glycerol-3-phosphate acyltransferase PlsY
VSPAQQVSLLVPVAYVVGSVPFGLIVGKSKGIDPRTAGSGNIGATNVGRLLGRRFFMMVFLLDLLKGLLPMLAAAAVLRAGTQELHDPRLYALWLLVGFAAILGHMFSLFLGFKGGKGVATSSGVILGLFPYFTIPGAIALAVWVVVLKGTRYISVASITAAIFFPALYVLIGVVRHWPIFGEQLPLLAFAVLVAGMIVYKHRSNIARLRAGTEPHYDERRADAGESGATAGPASAA